MHLLMQGNKKQTKNAKFLILEIFVEKRRKLSLDPSVYLLTLNI